MSKSNQKSGKGKGRGSGAFDAMKEEAANPGMFFAGLLASAFAAKAIDKFIPAPPDAEGKITVKKFIKPVILLGVGAGVAYFGRDKEYLRYLGYGIAAGGVVSATKVVIRTDIFGGLGDAFGTELQTMIDKIQADPNWLAAVKSKAVTNGNSVEDQIRMDAQWMIDQQGASGVGATRQPLRRSLDAEIYRDTANAEKQLLRQNSYDPDLSSEFENAVNGLEDENLNSMVMGLDKIEDADYEILGIENPSREHIL